MAACANLRERTVCEQDAQEGQKRRRTYFVVERAIDPILLSTEDVRLEPELGDTPWGTSEQEARTKWEAMVSVSAKRTAKRRVRVAWSVRTRRLYPAAREMTKPFLPFLGPSTRWHGDISRQADLRLVTRPSSRVRAWLGPTMT